MPGSTKNNFAKKTDFGMKGQENQMGQNTLKNVYTQRRESN
jgi:hypothetical protein